jgi:hypothetical protein
LRFGIGSDVTDSLSLNLFYDLGAIFSFGGDRGGGLSLTGMKNPISEYTSDSGRRQVAKLILSRGMGIVAVGLVVGLAGSYWATHLIQRLLYGFEPNDPGRFVVAALSFNHRLPGRDR